MNNLMKIFFFLGVLFLGVHYNVQAQSFTAKGYKISGNETLQKGEMLRSPQGRYELRFENDGNLSLVRTSDNSTLWRSPYSGRNVLKIENQSVVMLNEQTNVKNKLGEEGASRCAFGCTLLKLEDDGALILTESGNDVVMPGTASTNISYIIMADPTTQGFQPVDTSSDENP